MARRLAPCDPIICLSAGVLAAEAGEPEVACKQLRRAVELEGDIFKEAAVICVDLLRRPDIAVAMAGDNIHRLSQLAYILAESEGQKPLADQICPATTGPVRKNNNIELSNDNRFSNGARSYAEASTQIIEILKHRCSQPDAPAWAFASLACICVKENDKETAIENYRHALTLDYGQVDWRFSLARLLADIGAIPEAIQEAKICLQLRPQFVEAKKLIEDLSIVPEVKVPKVN
jgi:tetratricopeptide (TPR) repeat protein